MKYLDLCSCRVIPLPCQGSSFLSFLTFFPHYCLMFKGGVIIMDILFTFQLLLAQ